jgi:phosphoribosylamine--glycine ligase
MGAYSPVAEIGDADVEELIESVHRPVLAQLAARGTPFVGCLYAGLMLGENGIRVLEFNCRFGDPETQAILPRLEGDFLAALAGAAAGDLSEVELGASEAATVTVALAAERYPEAGDTGSPIKGVEAAEANRALVFHAGTAIRDGGLVTNGGRVLNVTGVGESLEDARARAYAGCEQISFQGMRYRTDVGQKAVNVAR